MAYTGKKFPNITVPAINARGEEININILEEAVNNKKKVLLFWYPKDFTFVCPTELHAFQAALGEFEKRNTIVIGASCDTMESHFAWLNTPKKMGGIEGVTYNLISDSNRNLSGVLDILDGYYGEYNEELDAHLIEGDYVSYRATYVIDEDGVVQHEGVNNMPIGRNVDEFLRIIDALAHNQEYGEVCPANWNAGDDAMAENRDGVIEYQSSH